MDQENRKIFEEIFNNSKEDNIRDVKIMKEVVAKTSGPNLGRFIACYIINYFELNSKTGRFEINGPDFKNFFLDNISLFHFLTDKVSEEVLKEVSRDSFRSLDSLRNDLTEYLLELTK